MVVGISHSPSRTMFFGLITTFRVDIATMAIWPFFPRIETKFVLRNTYYIKSAFLLSAIFFITAVHLAIHNLDKFVGQLLFIQKSKYSHCAAWHFLIFLQETRKTDDRRINVNNFLFVKYIYSEKATKFCEISTNYLSYVLPVK